ncbi:MAG: hypothetical protein WBL23_02140 [Salinisphaera sp.]|uniref:hypothetical protein n=1 Tax=Salinisphaera sp. TaxID=1914330 RepID=UPI003C79D5B0
MAAIPALAHNHGDDEHAGAHHEEARAQAHHHEGGQLLKVALWGDQFYAKDPVQRERMARQTIKSMNSHDLDFTLYAGDTKNGSSLCTDAMIGRDVVDRFNQLRAPTIYALGDNEWTDCHRTAAGGYDPLERLSYLRQVFFSQNKSQGRHPIKLERQGALGAPYSENSRFVRDDVEFVALDVPGSNNNLVATAHECHKKSNRTQAACDAATQEYRARNKADIAWLKSSFARARKNHYAGIAIVIQADIYAPFDLADGGYQDNFLPQLDASNGYTDFFKTLVQETHNFDGQVLLIHGDSHYYRIDKAMYDPNGQLTANFTRVEVFGDTDNSWIEMLVDPNSRNVFLFRPVILQ